MQEPQASVVLLVVCFCTVFYTPSYAIWKPTHPLLADIAVTQETCRRLDSAVRLLLALPAWGTASRARLPATERAEPSLAMAALDPGAPPCAEAALRGLHAFAPPLALLTGPPGRWAAARRARRTTVPPPRAAYVLLLLGRGQVRLRLARLLRAARGLALWYQAIRVALVLADAEALGAQRSLLRMGVFRSVGLVPRPDASSNASAPPSFERVLFQPSLRPPRAPPAARPPADWPALLLARRPVLRHHALVGSVYSHSQADADACLWGRANWRTDMWRVSFAGVAGSLGLRLLCYTKLFESLGGRLQNGTYLGMERAVAVGRADAMVIDVGADLDWLAECDLLFPHAVDALCVWVQRAGPAPFLESVAGALEPWAWAGVGLVLLVLLGIRTVAARRHPLSAFFDVIRAFVTGMFTRRDSVPALAAAMGASVFGVVVGALLQSSVASCLASPPLDDDLNTLEEVDERLSNILTLGAVGDQLEPNGDPEDLITRLVGKFYSEEDGARWGQELTRAANDDARAGVLMFDSNAILTRSSANVRGGYMLLHRVPQCVFSASPLNYVFKKYSPYAQQVQRKILQAVDSGLWKKFNRIGEQGIKPIYGLVPVIKGAMHLEPAPLTAEHVKASFYVLGVGLALAAVAFVVEWLCGRARHVGMLMRTHSLRAVVRGPPTLKELPTRYGQPELNFRSVRYTSGRRRY